MQSNERSLYTAQQVQAFTGQRLKDTAPESFYSIVGILIVFCLLATRTVFKTLSAYRAIKSIPTSLIRSAAQGQVELNGIQHSSLVSPLKSPLTLTACTWYDYVIQKKEIDTQQRVTWQTIYQQTSDTPILLRDKTGECWVFPSQATVNTQNIFMHYDDTGVPWNKLYPANRPLPTLLNFLWHTVNIITLGTLSAYSRNKPYRHIEKIMQANDPLYALGFFKSYHEAELSAFKGLLNTIKVQQTPMTWQPITSTQVPIHTLSLALGDKEAHFILSNTSEKKLMQTQRHLIILWLGIDLVILVCLGMFVTVY
ncbi:MAG: hypothetical protein RLZ35_1090 [Pseudomonadota bacterium]